MTRPTTRPSPPGNFGGGNRPGTLPGNIGGGNRPNLPGNIGGGNRPGTLPGNIGGGNRPNLPGNIGGNRPGTLPGNIGVGNRPNLPGNIGGNRPGTLPGNIGGGNRPNLPGNIGGNRPGTLPGNIGGGNRPNLPGNIGGGNRPTTLPGDLGGLRPGGGNNNGIINRPGGGNNNNIGNSIGSGNNINNGNTNNNWFGNNNNFNNVNIDGGGWGVGGGGWAGHNWSSGYHGYHGDWYRGSWNNNNFGSNRWGLGAFGTGFALGVGVGGLGYSYGPWGSAFNAFPIWSAPCYSGWGLGTWANSWMYSGYTNPYYVEPTTTVVNTTPQVVYNYSQPINVTTAPPEATVADQGESIFNAARESFKAADFASALNLTDQALQQLPNDPVLHEFRALVLFTLGRYDDAAAVLYAVLSAGPGWNWSTMIGLYGDANTYTTELRALESAAKQNPTSASTQFVLAYHYLVQGHSDQAGNQFQKVARLAPKDELSAKLAMAMGVPAAAVTQPAATSSPTPTPAPAPALAPAATPPQGPQLGPPPATLVGTWKAQPTAGLTIELTVKDDASFDWKVTSQGQPQSINGQAGFAENVLTLNQGEGPPLAGKVGNISEKGFSFQPLSGGNAPSLAFTKV